MDALAHDWPGDLLYAFPPFTLLMPFLHRVRTMGARVILVAPMGSAMVLEHPALPG